MIGLNRFIRAAVRLAAVPRNGLVKKSKILHFLRLTRPLFLLGGVMLYQLGALTALVEGIPLRLAPWMAGQLLVTSIQLMTHYANEYYDLECDRHNQNRTWFSGGSGVLASGMVLPKTAQRAAFLFAGFGVLFLAISGMLAPHVLPIGGLAIAAAWSYSGPPLTLVNTGWGEVVASVVVAGMVPLVGYGIQSSGGYSLQIILSAVPLVFLHLAMLIAFQIPDRDADAASGKRTVCVRLGLERTGRLHTASLFLAFCVILGLGLANWPAARLAWLAMPLAVWQAVRLPLYTGPNATSFLWLTMRAVGLFALTTAFGVAGLLLAWAGR
jgi:1,4-dihydroxy-2-naphthoate octaprenyltransferase